MKGHVTFFYPYNCYNFLASDGVTLQSDDQSYLKTPVCGTSLLHILKKSFFNANKVSVKSTLKRVNKCTNCTLY